MATYDAETGREIFEQDGVWLPRMPAGMMLPFLLLLLLASALGALVLLLALAALPLVLAYRLMGRALSGLNSWLSCVLRKPAAGRGAGGLVQA